MHTVAYMVISRTEFVEAEVMWVKETWQGVTQRHHRNMDNLMHLDGTHHNAIPN